MGMSITQKERRFPSATGLCDIVYRQWIPEEVRGSIVLVHDKAEHIARYDAFSKYLAENGFMVAGLDIPSHGKSWKEGLPRGFFGAEDGWGKVLSDIRTLCATVRKENPQISVTLFGNSLGSMLSQDYISRYTNDFDAAILCGTPSIDHMAYFRRFLCNHEIKAVKYLGDEEKNIGFIARSIGANSGVMPAPMLSVEGKGQGIVGPVRLVTVLAPFEGRDVPQVEAVCTDIAGSLHIDVTVNGETWNMAVDTALLQGDFIAAAVDTVGDEPTRARAAVKLPDGSIRSLSGTQY